MKCRTCPNDAIEKTRGQYAGLCAKCRRIALRDRNHAYYISHRKSVRQYREHSAYEELPDLPIGVSSFVAAVYRAIDLMDAEGDKFDGASFMGAMEYLRRELIKTIGR